MRYGDKYISSLMNIWWACTFMFWWNCFLKLFFTKTILSKIFYVALNMKICIEILQNNGNYVKFEISMYIEYEFNGFIESNLLKSFLNHSTIKEINTIAGQWKQWFIFDKGHIVIATIKSDRLWQHHWMINVARTYTTQQTCFFIFIFPHLRTN